VRGQFGGYLVRPLDLPPVPTGEFVESGTGGRGGETPEFR
jgi:hypothetical protein